MSLQKINLIKFLISLTIFTKIQEILYMSQITKNDQELRREEELSLIEEAGVNAFPYSFDKTHFSNEVIDSFDDENPEKLGTVGVAGRIMALRRMGKATFMHLLDQNGRIQCYFNKKLTPDTYDQTKLWDIGDIVGIKGEVFRTKTGEVTVKAEHFEMLCKSLTPLPIAKEEIDEEGNKTVHDAFKDKELRYRKRYIDLIVNSEVREIFTKRSKIITEMRRYFDKQGWLEVETPILQPLYGGASARPFTTHHNTLDVDMYMRIALELYLKRLIVGGYEGVYEISKNFRNEGMDRTHNPEFTMMEIYVAYKDYNWCMDMTEDLLRTIAKNVMGTYKFTVDENEIDLEPKFQRVTMSELFVKYCGEDLIGKSKEELILKAKELHVDIDENWSPMKIMDEILSEKIEPNLIQPTFMTDFPVEISPLAKKHREKEGLVERFELFVNGQEFANAFSELNDPRDQRARLEEQAKHRAGGDEEAMVLDEDFLNALEVGMPPTAGLGIGIDRLVMLLTGQRSIQEVLFFPQMKPEANA